MQEQILDAKGVAHVAAGVLDSKFIGNVSFGFTSVWRITTSEFTGKSLGDDVTRIVMP